MTKGWAMAGMVLSLAFLAGAAEADGPKRPETPFAVHVFTKSTEKDAVDSTADVRKAIQDKKKDWFRLSEDAAGADLVIEILGRGNEGSYENVIRGRLTAATVTEATIVGQHIVTNQAIWKMGAGPWTNAARDMANRLEKYCRSMHTELAAAQRRGVRVGVTR